MVAIVVTENMVIGVLIKHLHKVGKGPLTTLQEEMIVELVVHVVP